MNDTINVDAVVIGAGIAGLYAIYRLRDMGFSLQAFEAGDEVGGTWYFNQYPGARCDIESLDYSYSFSPELEQEWTWSERYASQPEILKYLKHVADRFSLRDHIQFDTRVVSTVFNDETQMWTVTTDAGQTATAKFLIMATGVLSVPQEPTINGLNTFTGDMYHSAKWPKGGVDFSGKKVAVIGTGSSGTQMIPLIAEEAESLYVLQRTPNYCMPAQNSPLSDEIIQDWKTHYRERRAYARQAGFGHNQASNPLSGAEVSREERESEFENRWELGGLYMMRAFKDILVNLDVNNEAAEFVRNKIRAIVKNPEVAEDLVPSNELPIGTKRLCSGTEYYETFNRENVSLINVQKNPIDRITENGVALADGQIDVDAIVFATGFDAMTGALLKLNPIGRGGKELKDHWAAGPRTYLGITVHNFPNMFIMAGPGSPSVFSNMVTSIEQHVEWATDAMDYLRQKDLSVIEATAESEQAWVDHANELANSTLYGVSRATWFYGANTPGKPQVFMPYVGGVGNYYNRILGIAANDYEGYTLSGQTVSA
jgi:cyclohexanone monooxygenase